MKEPFKPAQIDVCHRIQAVGLLYAHEGEQNFRDGQSWIQTHIDFRGTRGPKH